MSALIESPYTAAQRAVTEAHDALAATRARHKEEMDQAQDEVDTAVEHLRHLKAGTDPDTRELAETVVHVRGPNNYEREDGPQALQDAIRDLLNGAPGLRERFFGTKHYGGLPGQRCDCQYGFGPKHGSIVFAIELTLEARQRLKHGGELTPEETEAAIQFLTNLPAFVANGGTAPPRDQDVRF